ncbi:MAG TPA: peptide chain release factor N(5)-glutamine methyltransferase [Bacteroidia bacterium]|jgi:release factor glutamine methyltransferase|nr:peptide chain release factor N(5)-glutamine methyltransferase [Bacteroidia bacterium]
MRIPSTKIQDVLKFFRQELTDIYDAGEIETFILYCFEEFLNFNKTDLILSADENVTESELLKFNFAVKQLKQQRPIQYILGKADFYQLKFLVNEQVLIPRPETEELVDLIIHEQKHKQELSILDIGTGSGCIAIALKKNLPHANVTAIDISEGALEMARKNEQLNKVDITFLQADILKWQPDNTLKYDCIVSNPPYICFSEQHEMQKNVLEHEPHLALFVPNDDPLLFYRSIADFALKHLSKTGKLYFEINASYGLKTKEMLDKKGFKNTTIVNDLNNKNRILQASI